jgi:hypothetical protein
MTNGQSVCLGVKPHLGPKTRFLLLSDSRGFVDVGAPSLTTGRVCRLPLLLALARAVILGFKSRGAHDHILLSQIQDSLNLEGQLSVFISPRNRVAQLYLQHWILFRHLLLLAGLRLRYSNSPPLVVVTATADGNSLYSFG